MNTLLIADLRKRTLAEYSVFMTICGVGAFVGAMMIAGLLDHLLPGYALFAIAAFFWLVVMTYLWLHFYVATRRTQLAPSSIHLFHTIQYVALTFAAIPILFWRSSGWTAFLFSAISLGVEVALTAFFICHIFLAITLCRSAPRQVFLGLLSSSVGFYFAYRHVFAQ